MKYKKPDYTDAFYCAPEDCPATCPAPLDMTWTKAVGSYCQCGLSLACPRAARDILLHQEPTRYLTLTDAAPGQPPEPEAQSRLELILDARKTVELLLGNRSMALRPRAVLALTYCAELEPLLPAKTRFAYEELDWGFTEQPVRQFQVLVNLAGHWELKRSDMCNLLWDLSQLCAGDSVLSTHLTETFRRFKTLSGEEYRLLRGQFDQYLAPRDYLFENLMGYYIHRYFMDPQNLLTVAPGAKLMALSFLVLRTMASRIWQEAGDLTDEALTALCWHFARCMEENPEVSRSLHQRLEENPLYSWERLQRLLWK